MKLTTVLMIMVLVLFHLVAAKKAENSSFVATKEWQEIQEGQGIPAGLHIRINLQTGKKEAKLLNESEESGNKSESALLKKPDNENSQASSTTERTTKETLKMSKTLSDVLKNIPRDPLGVEYSPIKLEKIKRDYKKYMELKESYDNMRNNFKTDAEMITQLVSEYKNLSKTDKESTLTPQNKDTTQIQILEQLNYLVHQIDNALWFIDIGGLDQVLLPLIVNQTHIGLRVQAMRCLGALSQNNPKAQIKVFESNFGLHLTQILITSTNTEELSTALYALGSLLRKFPLAQQRILSTLGTQALIAVLNKECELKIKAKVATLISDIIVEKEFVLSASASEFEPLTAAQYTEILFTDWLQANSFCEALDTLITTKLYEFLKQPDLMDYFTNALESTRSFCFSLWSQSPQLRHTLLTLKNRYSQSKDEYQMELAEIIEKLTNILYDESVSHDEL